MLTLLSAVRHAKASHFQASAMKTTSGTDSTNHSCALFTTLCQGGFCLRMYRGLSPSSEGRCVTASSRNSPRLATVLPVGSLGPLIMAFHSIVAELSLSDSKTVCLNTPWQRILRTQWVGRKRWCHVEMRLDALDDLPRLSGQEFLGNESQTYRFEPQNDFQRLMRKSSGVVLNHIAARHSDFVRETIALVPPGKNYKSLPAELRVHQNFHVAWTRFPEDTPAPTIDTGHRHHFHFRECRVPTVRECARLQSFPDDFRFTGNKTQQFRQVGNAVPPLMAMAIGLSLKEALSDVHRSK